MIVIDATETKAKADAVGGGMPAVDFDPRGLVGALADLLNPAALLREMPRVGSAWVGAALGQPVVDFPGADRRFTDPAWQSVPLYRWVGQSYLAWAQGVQRLAEAPHLDAERRARAGYLARIITGAAAPTNVLAGNPAAIKRAVDTGGRSVLRGSRNMVRDLVTNGGLPAQVDTRPFRVGTNLAATPGAVVYREELFEILQYRPSTPRVHSRPLLVVPPQVNRHYVLDLAPGRSLIEYTISRGVQVFCVVWRNPRRHNPEHGRWAQDDYVGAQLRAVDVVQEITASPDVNVLGVCAGGLTTALMLGLLTARGDRRVHAAALMVTMVDSGPANLLTAMAGPRTRGRVDRDADRGVVYPRRALVRNFAWMRPDDLVFSYVANNWLLGDDPPAFDILAWNADATNLAAAFNRDLLDTYAENRAARPGRLTVLGRQVDLGAVRCDTLVVGGGTDHITPWRPCYRTSALIGGATEVIVTSTGHIQTLVNPPTAARGSFWHGPAKGPDPDAWRVGATHQAGSWWPTWAAWITARSGPEKTAPEDVGSAAHPAAEAAPGTYVYER